MQRASEILSNFLKFLLQYSVKDVVNKLCLQTIQFRKKVVAQIHCNKFHNSQGLLRKNLNRHSACEWQSPCCCYVNTKLEQMDFISQDVSLFSHPILWKKHKKKVVKED